MGNRLRLSDDAIAENLKASQRRNGLPPSPSLDSGDFEDAHNQPYVRLLSTRSRQGTISARVELDVEQAGKVRRREVTVLDGLPSTASRCWPTASPR